jgi:hypothetical protein
MKDIRIYNADSDITMFAEDIIADKKHIIGLIGGRLAFILDSTSTVILDQFSDISCINLEIGSRCTA